MSDEYDIYFRKFYSELFKYQTGKKNTLYCPGCKGNKRFIINDDELIFSCGPKNSKEKECGIKYTIKLPKYINFSELYKIYYESIHGSTEYEPMNILGFDLESLSERMDINKELESQKTLVKDSTEKLKKLLNEYIETNKLEGYIETLETLSEKREKNAYEKRKIMKSLKDEELSEPERIELRKKYAILVNESKEFINMIIELRKPNTEYICIKQPEIIQHDKIEDKSVEKDEVKLSDEEKIIDIILKLFTENDGKLQKIDYRKMIKKEGFKTLWGSTLFKSLQKGEHSWKSDLQDKYGSIIEIPKTRNPDYIELTKEWREYLKLDIVVSKKYSYEEQVKILINYYNIVDPSKTDEEIRKIVDRRRPMGTPIGKRIPTKPWLELCDKLAKKYVYHPIRIEEEKNMSLEEQDDGSFKLVYDLKPPSPRSPTGEEKHKEESTEQIDDLNLYNPDIVFQFYSKSKDLDPGKGAGEKIPDDKINDYKELSKIKNWRKMLSNFYESEFELDDKKWLSVEHYYQGSKFKKENPDFYFQFSLDSGSDISKDTNLAKAAGGKTGKYKGKQIRDKEIKMDKDFFKNDRNHEEMENAQREKYKNEELKKMLLLTKESKLIHFSRGSPPIIFTETMKIRKELQ